MHDASKPNGLRAVFSGAERIEAWQAARERIAGTEKRVEHHIELVTRLARPAIGIEAPSMRMARSRAAKRAPQLLEAAQQIRLARSANLVDRNAATHQPDARRCIRR